MRLKNEVIIKMTPVFSAITSAVLFLIIMSFCNVTGTGNYTILHGDAYMQYIDFIGSFFNNIKNGESIWYSFSLYMGSGTALNNAYYCLSPLNILYVIIPGHISTVTFGIITIKISLASLFFCIYAHRFLKADEFVSYFSSLLYALCSFIVANHFNFMWLDALFMLPVLVILIKDLIEKNKYLLLIFCYAYIFITNFYMAYMVGIFTAIVFVVCLLYFYSDNIKKSIPIIIKKCFLFGLSVLLAALCCMAVLLPAVFFLYSNMASDNAVFESLSVTVLDIVNSMFIGSMQGIDNATPILYCGIISLLLFPFYFLNKKILFKEKLSFGIVTAIYVIVMMWQPLYEFMHAFDYPNFYAYRFAFCFVFIILSIAVREISFIEDIKIGHVFLYAVILVSFYSLMIPIQNTVFPGLKNNTQTGMLVNFLFIFLWLGIFMLLRFSSRKKLIKITAIFLLFIEIVVNGNMIIDNSNFSYITENEFNHFIYDEGEAIDSIRAADKGFYRVIVHNGLNYNSACLFDYNSLVTFSSSDNYNLRRAVNHLGLASGNRFISNYGNTPVFNMLFGVKYYASVPYIDLANNDSDFDEEWFVLSEENVLGLGYMVSNSVLDYQAGCDPFINQESLVNCFTDETYSLYEPVPVSDISYDLNNLERASFDSAESDTSYVMYSQFSSIAQNASVTIHVKDEGRPVYACLQYDIPGCFSGFPYVACDHIGFRESTVVSESFIEYFFSPDDSNDDYYMMLLATDSSRSNFYYNRELIYYSNVDIDMLSSLGDDLGKNSFNISSYREDLIAGTVIATEDRPVLFTSIPYDEDWNVYVDGYKAEKLKLIEDAFLGVMLTPGEHEIVFQYIAKGSNEGMIITIVACMIYAVLVMLGLLKLVRKKESVTEESSDDKENNTDDMGDNVEKKI